MARVLTQGVAAALAGFLMTVGPARADAIDGNWCDTKGKTMSISGSTIVTPGGTRMDGQYSRHNFAYTVPERENGAGTPVSMSLVTENTIRLQAGTSGAPETWHRCEQTS
jgi:hypothetical protein